MKSKLFFLFILFSSAAGAQYNKLHDFTGSPDGSYPSSSLIYDGTYLYGTTPDGGSGGGGTVFKIMPDGTGYAKLFDFNNTTGYTPFGSLTSDGNFLYGMTFQGGSINEGTIFKIKPDGTGFTKLLNFNGLIGMGINPRGSLISLGTFLYGMTNKGGSNNNGTIFKIKNDGTGYATLLDFNGANGSYPEGALISDGTFLYGMTPYGGSGGGTVFKILPDGTGYTKLLDFNCANKGDCYPKGSLFYDGNFLYGMTIGGKYGNGTIFKIKPDGTGFVRLLDFNCDYGYGCGPSPERGSLISDGSFLYGMTKYGGPYAGYYGDYAGTIFKIKTDGTGYSKLCNFGGISGRNPSGSSLITDSTYLYGMTGYGGAKDAGVIFKIGNNTLAPVGIQTNRPNSEIKIFPNPSNEVLNVELAILNENSRLKITNLLGEEVLNEPLTGQHSTFNIQHLKSGVYFISLENNDVREVYKIMKEDK